MYNKHTDAQMVCVLIFMRRLYTAACCRVLCGLRGGQEEFPYPVT